MKFFQARRFNRENGDLRSQGWTAQRRSLSCSIHLWLQSCGLHIPLSLACNPLYILEACSTESVIPALQSEAYE